MIEIKNARYTVKINEIGAEIKRLLFDGEKRIYEGDSEYWNGSAPILFPICGRLRDGEYFYGGKRYALPLHGFARRSLFAVESATATSATFLLKSDEKTLEVYPFDFELRVTYTLSDADLHVSYDVKNLTDGDMYFSIGSHEAYYCPEGIEEYDVILPAPETLKTTLLEEKGFGYNKKTVLENTDVLPLKNEYFHPDALIFEDMQARELLLKHRYSDKAVRVKFPDVSALLLWTVPNAPYLCIEPWCGLPDRFDAAKDLETKELIIPLPKNSTWHKTHTITFTR